MTKRAGVLVLLVLLCSRVFCEEPILLVYQQNFSMADLSEKAGILKSAASDKKVGEFIGPLYEYALQFVLQFTVHNSWIQKNDPDMVRIIETAVSGIEKINYRENLDTLWQLFLNYSDSSTGIEIIVTIGKLGTENSRIIQNINSYLIQQNKLYRMGVIVNYPLISACITAILELGDSSSYPALFDVICSDFPEVIASEASGAMELIPGNYRQFLVNVIENNPPEEKLAALREGVDSKRLSAPECGQLAELALEQSFAPGGTGGNTDLSALRYAAIAALIPLRWQASNLVVRHYHLVQDDFQSGAVPKERFLEAIACLGASGNSDAALALVLRLGLINARTEKTGSYDEDITLAIIRALGLIGDKAAFSHLISIRYLPYTANIQAAAREALDRLKW